MKPIDADKIIEYCADACNGTFEARMFVEFMACIDEMPTLEVESIKYALWLFDSDWCGNSGVVCSGCHWCSTKNDMEVMKYKRCPSCGAYMKNHIKTNF